MPVFQLMLLECILNNGRKKYITILGFLVCFCMNLQVMLSGRFVAFVLLADTQQEIIIFQESLASFLAI